MCGLTCIRRCARTEVRRQPVGVGSLFLPCAFPWLNSGCQAWRQAPCPAEPSLLALWVILVWSSGLISSCMCCRGLPFLFLGDTGFFFASVHPCLGDSCSVKGAPMSGFSVRFPLPSCSFCDNPESCVTREQTCRPPCIPQHRDRF